MSTNEHINRWFRSLETSNEGSNKDTPHIVVGYGSLLSKQSRERYSNIRSLPLPISVRDWERSWVTRSIDEKQTYVGAYPCRSSSFNGQAFRTNIDKQLQKREQDYKFTEIQLEQLDFHTSLNGEQVDRLSQLKFYICESLRLQSANEQFPVNLSYIDTCLKGCFELAGANEVKRFVNTTKDWPSIFKSNDRAKSNYPRASETTIEEQGIFDRLQRQTNSL